MLIDKDHVVQTLRDGGRLGQAQQAEHLFDAEVDTADLLRELDLDPDSRARGGGLALVSSRPRGPEER